MPAEAGASGRGLPTGALPQYPSCPAGVPRVDTTGLVARHYGQSTARVPTWQAPQVQRRRKVLTPTPKTGLGYA
jgi:hypothetical protein